MQVVGRDAEIAELGGALDAVAGGGRRLVVLRGEAGIGKTRLLDVAAGLARERRFEQATGRATELERDVPLALFGDALRRVAPVPDRGGQARWEVLRGLAAELADLAGRRGLVLVLDDVHWADPVSLELLETLVRRPLEAPHALLVGLRPGPVADSLIGAARSTGRPGTVVDLVPLSREAAGALVGHQRTEEERGRLFEISGGNPMFLEELAAADAADGVPRGIVAAVAADVGRLGAAARALVEAGAVVGDPFDIDIARRTAGLGLSSALLAVDELVDRRLVRGTGSLREFGFRHPVIRSAVYEGQSAAQRLGGHARAAGVLADAGSPLPDRARHLVHAAAPGDTASAALLRAAAGQVQGSAPSIAADWLLAAKRVAPPADFAPFSDLAEVLVQSGRLSEALGVADEGLSFGAGRDADRVRLTLAAASVERLLGRHDAALRRLTRTLEETRGATGQGDLTAALALSAYERGDHEGMAHWAGLAYADESADPLARGAAAAMVAISLRFAGLEAEAQVAGDLSVDAVRRASDAELAAGAELVTAVPWALVALERLEDALATSRRGSAAARRAGNLAGACPLLIAEVLSLGLLGRVEAAVEAADRSELAARLTRNDQSVQWALWMRAWVLLDHGDLEEAVAAATESVALAERLDRSALVTIANAVLGSVLLAAGQPGRARPLLAAYDVEPGWVCRWATRLVAAEVALGDLDAAAVSAGRARALASELGLRGAGAAAHRATAIVDLARGEHGSAAGHAAAAIEQARVIGADLDAAQAHLLAAEALADRDREAAVAHLRSAHALAAGGGALRTAEEATRGLRRLGRRIGRGGARGSGATGIGALSGREREIAGLVAQGLTNREIAARLFLSEKTVESHLSKSFAKTGVASRAALAALVSSG